MYPEFLKSFHSWCLTQLRSCSCLKSVSDHLLCGNRTGLARLACVIFVSKKVSIFWGLVFSEVSVVPYFGTNVWFSGWAISAQLQPLGLQKLLWFGGGNSCLSVVMSSEKPECTRRGELSLGAPISVRRQAPGTRFSAAAVLQALEGFDEKRVTGASSHKIVTTLLERKRGELALEGHRGRAGGRARAGQGRPGQARPGGRRRPGSAKPRPGGRAAALPPGGPGAAQPSQKPTKKLQSECHRSAQ